MRDFPEEAVACAGLRGPLRLDDVLFAAGKASRIAPLQVVRPGAVLGEVHVRSAALHAHRAFAEKRNQADKLEVEFTRYLAGERQIRRALDKVGLGQSDPAGIAIALGDRRKDALLHFIDQLGLRVDDALVDADEARVAAWGFSEKQLMATTPERRKDLVLEAVALVDLA